MQPFFSVRVNKIVKIVMLLKTSHQVKSYGFEHPNLVYTFQTKQGHINIQVFAFGALYGRPDFDQRKFSKIKFSLFFDNVIYI